MAISEENMKEADRLWDEFNSSTKEQSVSEIASVLQSKDDEIKHWRANHKDMVMRLRVATQRPDLLADRIPAIKELARLQAENAALKKQLEEPSELTIAYMCGFHKRDDEIRQLQSRIKELEEKVSKSTGFSLDECIACGYPKSEHHYNGACYGLCGKFIPPPPKENEK